MQEKYHFIGIGGYGMSALAKICLEQDHAVFGSDKNQNRLKKLMELGAKIKDEKDLSFFSESLKVIRSSAIEKNHPQLLEANKQNLKVLHRSEFLSFLMQKKKSLLIAGTHGKTTVAALLSELLLNAETDPSFAVGGEIKSLQTNAKNGNGKYFIAEADESDGSFLEYDPCGCILTNIEEEHMDYWKDFNNLLSGFLQFARKVKNPNLLFYCNDDPVLRSLKLPGIGYGRDSSSSLHISFSKIRDGRQIFSLSFEGKKYSDIHLNLIGDHNLLNAAAVFGMGIKLGIDPKIIYRTFRSFQGVGRRMEKIGEKHSVIFYSDYAHHPTEIQTTLSGLRSQIKEKRMIAIFQPHRYSRLKNHYTEFLEAFDEADTVFLTDVYSAGEKEEKTVLDRFFKDLKSKGKKVFFLHEDIFQYLEPHDCLIALGAGDIHERIIDLFERFSHPRKWKIALVYGGRSHEHEISCRSKEYVRQSLISSLYEIQEYKIEKNGQWQKSFDDLLQNDICIPMVHGSFGEDGALQGLFSVMDKAYVGSDYRSSSLCMDKAKTKRILSTYNIPFSPFIDFSSIDWKNRKEECLNRIKKLTFPLFVKPNSQGSSIGISYVENPEECEKAIEEAFLFDHHLIIEEKVNGREIEIGVIGNRFLEISFPGEIILEETFYDYEKKYGENTFKTIVPAKNLEEKYPELKKLAERIYRKLNCSGMARIDFFYNENGFYFNEVNTIPGFTSISLFPKMFEASSIDGKKLMDRLLCMAKEKKRTCLI